MMNQTKRPISPGAEKWLGEEIPVLDHGKVVLIDYMGNDESIDHAARVSYGKGTRKVSETEGLIRYLRRHDHTSPFEMIEVKFAARMPIFVARQWVRHRTASINEYSARYSVVPDEFYVPETEFISLQSTDNKQGRGEVADAELRDRAVRFIRMDAQQAYAHYTELIDSGLARELARSVLPVGYYTEWYWKVNLHNLMHFLKLRLDSHAQYEVRVYADVIADIISDAFPIAWQAFVDYELAAVKFSRLELSLLRQLGLVLSLPKLAGMFLEAGLKNQGERLEVIEKLLSVGIMIQSRRDDFDQYAKTLSLSEKATHREWTKLKSLNVVT